MQDNRDRESEERAEARGDREERGTREREGHMRAQEREKAALRYSLPRERTIR